MIRRVKDVQAVCERCLGHRYLLPEGEWESLAKPGSFAYREESGEAFLTVRFLDDDGFVEIVFSNRETLVQRIDDRGSESGGPE